MKKLLFILVLVTPVLASAQMAPAPKELDKFVPFLGTWSGDSKWTVEGETTDIRMTQTLKKEGNFIVGDVFYDMMGTKMSEKFYIGWNEEKKMYHTVSFTDWAPTPRIEWGNFKDGVFTSTSEPWQAIPGEKTTGRIAMSVVNGKISYKMDFKIKDKWEQVAAGFLTKK